MEQLVVMIENDLFQQEIRSIDVVHARSKCGIYNLFDYCPKNSISGWCQCDHQGKGAFNKKEFEIRILPWYPDSK